MLLAGSYTYGTCSPLNQDKRSAKRMLNLLIGTIPFLPQNDTRITGEKMHFAG
jgi:hypothetical protein